MGVFVLHTSESLVAWCDGEGALLHSQLVKLGELWRDSSRGRLWEWERRQGEKWRKWKTQEEGKTEQKHHSQYRQLHKEPPPKKDFTHHSTLLCVDLLSFHKALHGWLVSDNRCVLWLVYVGYPISIPPKCRLHLLVMLSCSLQVREKSQFTRESIRADFLTVANTRPKHEWRQSQHSITLYISFICHCYSWKGKI